MDWTKGSIAQGELGLNNDQIQKIPHPSGITTELNHDSLTLIYSIIHHIH